MTPVMVACRRPALAIVLLGIFLVAALWAIFVRGRV